MILISIPLGGAIYGGIQYMDQSPVIQEEITEPVSEELTKDHNLTSHLVNVMIKTYDKNNQQLESLDGLLGFNVSEKGLRYGFVLDKEMVTIAHYNTEFVGKNVFATLKTTEPKEEILSTLETQGQIWIHYEFINPENDLIEPKTTLLILHNGLIFGSGFYN